MEGVCLGIAVGTIVFVVVGFSLTANYRRKRHRADLLRNLDHHEWCRWTQQ